MSLRTRIQDGYKAIIDLPRRFKEKRYQPRNKITQFLPVIKGAEIPHVEFWNKFMWFVQDNVPVVVNEVGVQVGGVLGFSIRILGKLIFKKRETKKKIESEGWISIIKDILKVLKKIFKIE